MADFHETDFGIRVMGREHLDTIALKHAGVVGSIGYGYACRDHACEDVDLAGGWRARWVDTRGMGNHGTLVLVPTDRRTRALLREGRIASYMQAGLTRVQAEAVHHCRASYKAELAPVLVTVLADQGQTGAMLAHPGDCGPGSGRSRWLAFYGERRSDAVAALSAPREAALARMVWACVRSGAEVRHG